MIKDSGPMNHPESNGADDAGDAPVLLLVDDDPRTRGFVEGELRKRYGSDYQVSGAGSADDALRLLAALRDGGRSVAVVLAGHQIARTPGIELLGRVSEFHRTAKRVLLVGWEDQATSEPIVQAIALGRIDAYVAKPATVRDERFHRAVTELLEEWARSNLPGFQAVRVLPGRHRAGTGAPGAGRRRGGDAAGGHPVRRAGPGESVEHRRGRGARAEDEPGLRAI